jgi:mxaK protein
MDSFLMTTRAAAVQRSFSVIADLRGFFQRTRTILFAALFGVLVLAAATAAALWGMNAARNRTIAALMNNHDVKVATDSAPRVIFARAYFFMTHGRLDDAQVMVSMLDIRGSNRLRADLHYDMANARLKHAFDMIREGKFDAAGALVGLAREDYREALRLDPDDWNVRFNFDVASRLVREYPTFGQTPDARRRGPHPLWTEMPNIPRGEP